MNTTHDVGVSMYFFIPVILFIIINSQFWVLPCAVSSMQLKCALIILESESKDRVNLGILWQKEMFFPNFRSWYFLVSCCIGFAVCLL